MKVTVFGDSIGKGVFTDGGKIEVLPNNAVKLFEAWYGIEIDNRSAYGQSLKRLNDRGVIDKYIQSVNPDEDNVLVLELGGNDSDFDWRSVASSPQEEHYPKTRVEEFSSLYGEVLQKCRAAGIRTMACTIVPVSSALYFNNVINRVSDGERVLSFFNGDVNTIHRHQELFNNEILKNAYTCGASVIDLRREFLNTNEFERMMCRDGIHPNALGHARIFDVLKSFAS